MGPKVVLRQESGSKSFSQAGKGVHSYFQAGKRVQSYSQAGKWFQSCSQARKWFQSCSQVGNWFQSCSQAWLFSDRRGVSYSEDVVFKNHCTGKKTNRRKTGTSKTGAIYLYITEQWLC